MESTIGLGEKQFKVSYLLDFGNDEQEEDWYWERNGWEQGIVSSVYGYNWDEPWRSEFGSITVSPNGEGGLFNDEIDFVDNHLKYYEAIWDKTFSYIYDH